MFVKLCASRLHREERGSAFAAVIGIFAVTVILAMVAGSATINAIGFTSATRAGVQSNAAAEAGINFVVSQLQKGTCKATFTDADAATELGVVSIDVEFTVTVTSRTDLTSDWPAGCPTAASTQVRLLSSGTASMSGLGGQTRGDSQQIEAVYLAAPSSTGIHPSGAAIYAYSSTDFDGSGKLLSVDGSKPSVQVKHGNVSCSGLSSVPDDMIIADGELTVGGSCGVAGNVWSSGSVELTGDAVVGGTVTSSGFTMSGSSKVGGSVWSNGPVVMPGTAQIGGNLVGSKLTMIGSAKVVGDAWTTGTTSMDSSTRIVGNLTAKSKSGDGKVLGVTTLVPAGPGPGPAAAPTPLVPDWVDFAYDKDDWEGFSETSLSGNCDYIWWPPSDPIQSAITSMAGAPGILDARGCSGGFTLDGSRQIKLTEDTVIVANKFTLSGSAKITSLSNVRLWLIISDNNANGLPTCAPGSAFNVGGSFGMSQTVTAMIYSPCFVNIGSSIDWRGQLFASSATVDGAATLNYVQVGLPGVDLTTGLESGGSAGSGASLIAARVSIRDTGLGG